MASIRSCLNSIVPNGAGIALPGNWAHGEDVVAFRGTNGLTKQTDHIVAVQRGAGNWISFRFSGKKQVWTKFRSHTSKPTVRSIASEGNLTAVTTISVILPTKTGGAASTKPKLQKKISPTVAKEVACSNSKRKKGSFMNLKKIFGRIGKADKGDFAISLLGGVAVKTKEGSYACLSPDGNLTNIETMAIDLDAFFYMPSAIADLKVNDVVHIGNGVGFVTGVDGRSVQVYDVNSQAVRTIKPANHFLFPQPFVTKVVSLLGDGGNLFGGGTPAPEGGAPAQPFNPLLLLLMGKDGGLDGDDDMMKMLLLSGALGGGAGGLGGMNPLLLMLLLKGDDEDDKGLSGMLPMLLLSGGLGGAAAGGAGGINPLAFAALSGGLGGCCKTGECTHGEG